MSESRWRQIVTGVQAKAGGAVPVRAPARKVVAMALAVQVDPAAALDAAELDVSEAALAAMVREAREPDGGQPARRPLGGLAEEIEQIRSLPIAPEDKIRIANALIQMYRDQAAAEGVSRAGDENPSSSSVAGRQPAASR